MDPRFVPFVPNGHAQTVLSAFYPHRVDQGRYPVETRLEPTEPGTRLIVKSQRPIGEPRGQIVLVHGLCGTAESGYMRSLAWTALDRGFAVHRLNLRGAEDTEELSATIYHAGLTADLHNLIPRLADGAPLFLAGYSLGGNVVLKYAGELGERGPALLAGVCAVSTPVDLQVCVDTISRPVNWFYQDHFVRRLKQAIVIRHRLAPSRYPVDRLDRVRTVFDFDSEFVAPAFGFRDAPDYYQTQSALRFIPEIGVPTLLLQAQDDPMIPFRIYSDPAILGNPAIERISTAHGGHNAFLSPLRPRNWGDHAVLRWIEGKLASRAPQSPLKTVSGQTVR